MLVSYAKILNKEKESSEINLGFQEKRDLNSAMSKHKARICPLVVRNNEVLVFRKLTLQVHLS